MPQDNPALEITALDEFLERADDLADAGGDLSTIVVQIPASLIVAAADKIDELQNDLDNRIAPEDSEDED